MAAGRLCENNLLNTKTVIVRWKNNFGGAILGNIMYLCRLIVRIHLTNNKQIIEQ